jgi:hypothetical protein
VGTGRIILIVLLTLLAMALTGWLGADIYERQIAKRGSPPVGPPHSAAAESR